MKQILFAIAALLMTACAGQQSQYKITGSVEGIADGTVLQLVPMSHDKEESLGEVEVKDGQFQFTGTAEEPVCVHIVAKDCYGYATLMLENKTIDVKGSVSIEKGWDGTPVYGWDVTVTGSPLTDEYNTYMEERAKLDALHAANQEKYAPVWDKMKDMTEAEVAAFKQTDEYKEVEAADAKFFQTVDSVLNGLILSHKDSFWGPLLAMANMSYFTPEQRELFNQFSQEAQESWYGRKMKEELWPAGTVGEKIDVFAVKDEAGNTVTFADLAKGKTYVLIDFWASWCGPCRKEIPNVKRQYELYKDKGFEVVSISIDRDAEAWKKAVEEEQLEWPNFLSGEVADQFKVKAVPTMYLVTADGTIVAENENARGEALAAKLAELYK